MRIAIDFDGVIVDSQDFDRLEIKPDLGECKPIKGSKEGVLWLQRRGHDLYVCTARPKEDLPYVKLWLKQHGFNLRVSNIKERGTTIFLDDRAYRFTNWLDFTKLIY